MHIIKVIATLVVFMLLFPPYFFADVNANLLFKINGIKQKLEVTIPLKNFTLRVEEVGNDFYAVVDTAVDKLERQIRKNKTRLNRNTKESVKEFNFDYEVKEEETFN